MKNPFPMSNYPPGVSDSTPYAPWSEQVDSKCYVCGTIIEFCDMSQEELVSYEDNDNSCFMCDECAVEDED